MSLHEEVDTLKSLYKEVKVHGTPSSFGANNSELQYSLEIEKKSCEEDVRIASTMERTCIIYGIFLSSFPLGATNMTFGTHGHPSLLERTSVTIKLCFYMSDR
ncbi:unnamed protein product [Vicia faba]|uniref:Uncharacterized protein n=1 Tax=Vicia faba TaxID=3906 RepID=A0AAV1A9X7_VICFA|nr:unnamed protein product [Vicia faba]